jgi:hypothetical protein
MKRYLSVLLVIVLLLSALAGCGAKEEAAVSSPGAAPMATEAVMEEVLYDEASSETGSGTTLPENQKLIRTVHMDAQTLSMNPLMAWLDSRVAELGGYYEQKSVRRSGSRDDGSYYQFADLMIRIPAENLDQFVSQIGEEANVTSKSETTENVTLTYVSTQSRVLALETEQTRLLELLENAQTMEDLLTIEERLTEVRWQLENYASQLRVLDNQVNYSTIYLNIREVDEPTVMTERTVWQKIGDGFSENAIDLWTGMVNIFVWLLSSLPYLIPLAVVAVLGWKFGKKMKNKKAKKSQPEEK